jgi:hypothetical protein
VKFKALKKLLAITLLLIHLFNLAGYPLLFGYLSQHSSVELANKINNNEYSDEDLVEVKIPFQVPYYNSSEQFESFAGEITIDGKHFNYVKRKMWGDTLYIMCLPNVEKDELAKAEANYGAEANDLGGNTKNDLAVKKGMAFAQYHFEGHDYSLFPPTSILNVYPAHINEVIVQSFIDTSGQPPEVNS